MMSASALLTPLSIFPPRKPFYILGSPKMVLFTQTTAPPVLKSQALKKLGFLPTVGS